MYGLPQQLLSNLHGIFAAGGGLCAHTRKKKTIAAARDIRTKFEDKALGYEENWQKCLRTEQNQL